MRGQREIVEREAEIGVRGEKRVGGLVELGIETASLCCHDRE